MSYTKHNYQKGDELLASQLNDMDDQIALNEETADTLVTVSNTEPTAEKNRVWVKATPSEIEIPTMDDLDEVNRQLSDETTGLDTKAPVIFETASGAIASFDDGADSMPIRKIVATIEPLQSGTGDPSPDNVRPISGWTGANIEQTGKSIVNPADFAAALGFTYNSETGVISGQNYPTRTAQVGKFKENTRYTVSFKYKGESDKSSFFAIVHTDGTKQEIQCNNNDWAYYSITSAANKTVYGFRKSYGSNIAIQMTEFMVEESPVATSYTPYVGNTLSVNWQSEAGTIYEGTLTLNEDGSADVVSEFRTFNINGAENWKPNSSYSGNAFYISRDDMKRFTNYVGTFYCDKAQVCSGMNRDDFYRASVGITGHNLSGYAGQNWLYLKVDGVTTASGIKEWLANNPLQVCYQLVTPTTYHFSNIGQLYTFLGQNNVWCDTGDITELTYPADTKLFLTARDEEITGNIAPIENGTTASKAYAQGAYFWHDTKFCKALTAIASGATFTLGTNYQETTVAAELLAAQN